MSIALNFWTFDTFLPKETKQMALITAEVWSNMFVNKMFLFLRFLNCRLFEWKIILYNTSISQVTSGFPVKINALHLYVIWITFCSLKINIFRSHTSRISASYLLCVLLRIESALAVITVLNISYLSFSATVEAAWEIPGCLHHTRIRNL